MFASYFYTGKVISKEEIETLFLELLCSDEQEGDVAAAVAAVAQLYDALFPSEEDTLTGEEAEELFRKSWVKAYVGTIRRLRHPDFSQERGEDHWCGLPETFDPHHSFPKKLVIRAGFTCGEVEAERGLAVEKYFQEHAKD